MKRIMTLYAQATNIIPGGIAMFTYLTPGTNRAMFTYLTPGTNRIKYYSTKKSYSREMGVIYTNFIKALLYNRLNLDAPRFNIIEEIINYLEGFQRDKLFTRAQISKFKSQGEFERVPLTPKSKEFIKYVQKEFPDFDGFEFTLIKPITKKEGKSQLVINNKSNTKHEPAIKSIKAVSEALPTIIQKESTVVNLEATPTVTETITKIVEPVVTETIVKVVEPVAKVVEPLLPSTSLGSSAGVVKVVETITKPVMKAIPNIIINNANTNSAHATTVTSNTQVASSN
jgi:hypothetical protein